MAYRHVRVLALRYYLLCWRKASPLGKLSPQATDEVGCLQQMLVLEPQAIPAKINLMPRPPLLGEVASSASDDDGEVAQSSCSSLRRKQE